MLINLTKLIVKVGLILLMLLRFLIEELCNQGLKLILLSQSHSYTHNKKQILVINYYILFVIRCATS